MPAKRILSTMAAAATVTLFALAVPAAAQPTVHDVADSIEARDAITISIAHQPQPIALQGQAIAVPVAVASDCQVPVSSARFCSEIRVELHWQTGIARGVLADHTPSTGGSRTFLVPGDAVEGDLTYWIEAHQFASELTCLGCWNEQASARSPHTDALFKVSVIND